MYNYWYIYIYSWLVLVGCFTMMYRMQYTETPFSHIRSMRHDIVHFRSTGLSFSHFFDMSKWTGYSAVAASTAMAMKFQSVYFVYQHLRANIATFYGCL